MGTNRLDRVNQLLQKEIAGSLYRILPNTGVDLATVTVTHVITSPDLRNARVLISVMGDQVDGQRVINVLNKYRVDIQKAVSSVVVLKFTPVLKFALDTSLEQGDQVLQLLDELDARDRARGEEPLHAQPEPPKEENGSEEE